MSWVFEDISPMGGASGEAYANTLKAPGMRPEHLLSRESIQNSVDARNEPEGKVRVRFRSQIIRGASKTHFLEAAALEDIAARAQVLELRPPNCLSALHSPANPIELLYIEDYKTKGLSGEPHDMSSDFFRLLLSLGDKSKARHSAGSGGSYGFGKSVYSASSAIQTLFAYTRFYDEQEKKTHTRLFGCGYYASHAYKKTFFSGRAWLGKKPHRDSQGRVVVDPLEDSMADTRAKELGFTLRDPSETGTTILVIDAAIEPIEIARGIEDWWWPRLVENQLDAEVIDADGKSLVPRPKKRGDLRPFIEAFEIARQRTPPQAGLQKYQKLNNVGHVELGSCGFCVVPLTDSGPVVGEDRTNTVAMIRAPLMVVSYTRFSQGTPPVIGAYCAADTVDEYLKLSEPPAHDKWDPDSGNLRDKSGAGKEIVNAVLSRVRSNLRRFQADAAPPPPPKQKRLSVLERTLASFFKPLGQGSEEPPEPSYSPLHLVYSQQPKPEPTPDGKIRLKTAFSVSLDERADDEVVELKLRVASPVIEDDNQEGDDVPVKITSKDVSAKPVDGDPASVLFKLKKGLRARFAVVSEPYDPTWTVRVRPEISREDI
jgi:hypothetical protein